MPIMPGIREHQRHWPLYRAMSVIIENADGYGHGYTRIGQGPSEVTPLEAKNLLRARYVTQFSDQFGTALEPTRKGRDYWEDADEAFMKLGGRDKKRWMKRYEELTGNPQPKPRDYWDTATYLFNQGLEPEDAAAKFKKRASSSRVASRFLKASTGQGCGTHGRRRAYNYNDDVGGTLSWEVHLGGDKGNFENLGADSRSWDQVVKQIVRELKAVRSRHGGRVEGVQVGRGTGTLRVYFDYNKPIEADDAFYDSERALKDAVKALSDSDLAYEWVLHGSVHGVQRSNLEIKNEAIEAGFEDTSRVASRKTADLEGVSRRKVVEMVNHVIDRSRLKGFFHDEYWAPVQRIWKGFDQAGIAFAITKSEYQHESMGDHRVPVRKIWRFEVPYTNERGRPGIVHGQVVAAGGGPVDDPLATYDVTAYAS